MTERPRPGLMRPPAPCPVCGIAVAGGGRCADHPRESWHHDESRQQRGYGSAWQRARRAALRRDHWRCTWPGCVERADEVDHIVPLREGGSSALVNLRSLCSDHHGLVTQASRRLSAERRRSLGVHETSTREQR